MIINTRIIHRDLYKDNIAYHIFTLECIVAAIHIILDLGIVRLFLYSPQLCSEFSPIFIKYPILNDVIFPIYNYCRVFKTLTQTSIIVCRLICVKRPMAIKRLTAQYGIPTIFFIVLFPILIISNTIFSRKEVVFWYGGFFTIYHRKVEWISLSLLHLFCLFISTFIILISSISIYRNLPSNMNTSLERSLFINSSFAGFGLLLQASFQSYYALFRYQTWFPDIIIHSQFVIYDIMTVGCPLMMLYSAREFRSHLFACCENPPSKSTDYEFQSLNAKKIRKEKENNIQSIHFDMIDASL